MELQCAREGCHKETDLVCPQCHTPYCSEAHLGVVCIKCGYGRRSEERGGHEKYNGYDGYDGWRMRTVPRNDVLSHSHEWVHEWEGKKEKVKGGGLLTQRTLSLALVPDMLRLGPTWRNQLAVQRVAELTARYGVPHALDATKGGMALWKSVDIYVKIEIWDRIDTIHGAHMDFLFVTTKLRVPPEKIGRLHKISHSISYWALPGECTARCHFEGAGVATLKTVHDYADGRISFEEARDTEYGKNTGVLVKEMRSAEAEVKRLGTYHAHLHATPIMDKWKVEISNP